MVGDGAQTARVPSVMGDYDTAHSEFTWDTARRWLDGLPGGGRNIAHEAVDRHVLHGRGDHVAFRFVDADGLDVMWTYAQLAERTSRFAEVLRAVGVGPGDLVCGLSGRIPDLYVALLGTLKARSVFSPLFSAFGPEPIRQRMAMGHARLLVTTPTLYRKKVDQLRADLPELEHVLLIGPDAEDLVGAERLGPGVVPLAELWPSTTGAFAVEATDPEEPALIHFTSGTTGRPKGAVHVHDAVVAQHATARYVLDLRDDDVFWCTADPGWVTGTSYGVIAPLTCGVTCVVDELEFDARRWYQLLEQERVTVWYTAPTALRMLMRSGSAPHEGRDLSALRHVASVGEPLNPEVVHWGLEELDRPIRDTWWQTETGAIMVANYHGTEVRPGSMGRPVPGIEAVVLARDAEGAVLRGSDGGPVVLDAPDSLGELALRRPWPSLMRAYVGAPERYAKAFLGDWYLSGDLVRRDAEGWFWFVGRGDDVIKSAGHLIGPFEVESALLEHRAVAEAGVIGIPDPIVGEVVKAFVALKPGFEPTDSLRREILGFGRSRLGNAVAPREITFQQDLPKTRSGKIMRRLLKARELGLPEGDLSTLEVPS